MLATSQLVPTGYYKDPQKSSHTFREIDGVRYSFPGDYASISKNGALVFIGRGAMSINSGGEKVFPEEVEEVVKLTPGVFDCLVVGAPDEKYVERVVAIVAFETGSSASEIDIINTCRSSLAGYKTPRQVIVVPHVERSENGKADYRWALATAMNILN